MGSTVFQSPWSRAICLQKGGFEDGITALPRSFSRDWSSAHEPSPFPEGSDFCSRGPRGFVKPKSRAPSDSLHASCNVVIHPDTEQFLAETFPDRERADWLVSSQNFLTRFFQFHSWGGSGPSRNLPRFDKRTRRPHPRQVVGHKNYRTGHRCQYPIKSVTRSEAPLTPRSVLSDDVSGEHCSFACHHREGSIPRSIPLVAPAPVPMPVVR